MYIDSFKQHFHGVDDPRQSAKVTYLFFDILFGTLCAVIAGARGWFDIREYLLGHHDWFIRLDMFKNGVPVDDTIARTISGIRPEQFQRCFLKWMASVHELTQGELVAIDGKTLRGSYNRDDRNSTIHMVSTYATANKLILGQLKTDDKSNEITAIPELLRLLDLRGSLVSIDAMACQARIARTIVEQGGDYLLAVKGNQNKLSKAVQESFRSLRDNSLNFEELKTERHHGRIESRVCHVLDARSLEGDFSRWNGLTTLAMVTSFRTEKGKSTSLEYRYYISSKKMSAEQVADAVREHWAIESMHWVLDVSMHEDACQIYKGHSAENLACQRHTALNMLRAELTRLSIAGKQKRCWMKTGDLEKVLVAGLSTAIKN